MKQLSSSCSVLSVYYSTMMHDFLNILPAMDEFVSNRMISSCVGMTWQSYGHFAAGRVLPVTLH